MSKQIVSVSFIAVGAGLALWGYQISEGFGSQLTNILTGSHTDKVMMLYIGGAASFTVGLFLSLKK